MNEVSNNELLACPFCGGNANLNFSAKDDVFPISLWGVDCSECPCNYGASENKEDAIRRWNTRWFS